MLHSRSIYKLLKITFTFLAIFLFLGLSSVYASGPPCYEEGVEVTTLWADALAMGHFTEGPHDDYINVDQGSKIMLLNVNETQNGIISFKEKCIVGGDPSCEFTSKEAGGFNCNDGPQNAAKMDANGDGYDDLVVTNFDKAFFFPNIPDPSGLGGRTFALPTILPTDFLEWTKAVAVAYVDKDKNPDIIIAGTTYHNGMHYAAVSVGLNNGYGKFPKFKNFLLYPFLNSYGHKMTFVVAQLVGSSAVDLALVAGGGQWKKWDKIAILPGDEDTLFDSSKIIDIPIQYNSRAITAADFNKDGLIDLAVGTEAKQRVGVLFNDGNDFLTSLYNPFWLKLPDGTGRITTLLTDDIDSDEDTDLFVAIDDGHGDTPAYIVYNNLKNEFGLEAIGESVTQAGFGRIDPDDNMGLITLNEDEEERAYLRRPECQ